MQICTKFDILEDPRHQGYIKHKLSDILIMVMCSVLCGIDKLCDIMSFIENKAEFFEKNFGITTIPSKATLSRILSIIDGEKVAKIIIEIMKEQISDKDKIIAVDGKAIRSTSNDTPHSALQIITAYLTESGIVIGEEKIHNKTNEIPILHQMLDYLDIKNKIITADAMHCQKKTCEKIIENHGDYVLGLKNNQKRLYEDISLYFEDNIMNSELDTFTTIEKNHGRLEKRVCKKLSNLSWLEEKSEWAGLKTVFSITRTTTINNKVSKETCYYISSLDMPSQNMMYLAREHWKIESMHWMLDVVFSEDSCRFWNDNAHLTLNIFRKYALHLHKHYISSSWKKSSIKQSMFNSLLNDAILLDIIYSIV